jgi:hypothetical protein
MLKGMYSTSPKKEPAYPSPSLFFFVGLSYQGKDIVLRFIIEYSSLRDFGP